MSFRIPLLRHFCVASAAFLVVSCASQPGTASGMTGVCQECYDAVHAAHTSHPSMGATHNEVIRTHECPCCKSEMSVYVENGVHMVKCGGCAADGVAWDKCTPTLHQTK